MQSLPAWSLPGLFNFQRPGDRLMHIVVFMHGAVSLVPNLQLIQTVTVLLIHIYIVEDLTCSPQ